MNKEAYLKKVGIQLKKLRLEKKLSLREIELNNDDNIDRSFLSKVELGKTNLTIFRLKKVADAYKIKVSDIFKAFD